jgi:hypothetical protein
MQENLKKAFEIVGDTIYELTVENETLTEKFIQIGEYDGEKNDFYKKSKI